MTVIVDTCVWMALIICAVAVRHRMRIFTTDTDFDGFAKHLPIDRHEVRSSK